MQVVLLNSLQSPISRSIYDYIVRSPMIDKLFECLQDRQLIRNICRLGHKPNYGDMDEQLTQVGACGLKTLSAPEIKGEGFKAVQTKVRYGWFSIQPII